MPRCPASRCLTRRSVIGLGLGLTLGSVLAACGQAAPPTNTAAPAKPAAPAPTTAPAGGGATTAAPAAATAPAAAAAAAKPAEATKPAATTAPAAAQPATKASVSGSLTLIQERGFNPLQTTYMHDTIAKVAQAKGWPLDAAYQDSFTG